MVELTTDEVRKLIKVLQEDTLYFNQGYGNWVCPDCYAESGENQELFHDDDCDINSSVSLLKSKIALKAID